VNREVETTLGPKDPACLLVQAVLSRGLTGLLLYDAGVRTGKFDAVHQLRVTCRRLRSELRALRPLLDDPRVDGLRAELGWLAGELGEARDLEVLRVRVARTATAPESLNPLPLDAVLSGQQAAADLRAVAALDKPRHLALLALLRELLLGLTLHERAAKPCRDVLPKLQRTARRRLDAALASLDGTEPDEAWHAARKLAKRNRYVAELVGSVLGGSRGGRRARRLQEQLGEHNDAVVAAERLAVLAAEHPELAVLCGRLIERERAAAAAVRRTTLAGLA
jgi:CHAD domain-containing protein